MKAKILSLLERYKTSKMSGVEYARYKGVKVGDDSRVYTRLFGSEPWLIEIGNKVTIAPKVQFITHDGSTWLFSDEKGRRQLYRKVVVGNEVFVGINSIILPGVKISSNVIVAAGSVITKSIPQGKIVGGNPAKIIGDYFSYEKKVLDTYVSNSEMNFESDRKTRIDMVLDPSFKKFMD